MMNENLRFPVVTVATPVALTDVTMNDPAPGTHTRSATPTPIVSQNAKTIEVAETKVLVTTHAEAPDAIAARPVTLLIVVLPGVPELSVYWPGVFQSIGELG